MEQLFDLALINSALRVLTPILLAALGGALCSRVGLFNVGLEGFIFAGGFLCRGGEPLLRQRLLCDIVRDCNRFDFFFYICLSQHQSAGERHCGRYRDECVGGGIDHV